MGHTEKQTILLVDDEASVLDLCSTILKLNGYSTLPARSEAEALKLLQSNTAGIALALLDVMMPDGNGIELAKHIQSLNPAIKIVLMSGFAPQEIARVAGGNPYRIIWKPFQTESLLRMIENAMGTTGMTMTMTAGQ